MIIIDTSSRTDALHAYGYAMGVIGQPEGSAIYIAIDVEHCVLPYFRAVRRAFEHRGGKLKLGVYGGGAVRAAVLDANIASFAWISQQARHRGAADFLPGGRWTLLSAAARRFAASAWI